MRVKTLAAPIGGISLTGGAILLLGAYFYVFLGAAPVASVTQLHTSIGLEGLVSLDAFFGLGHTVAYGALMLSLCAVFKSAGSRPAIAATLMGVGVGIEVLQEEFFGRQFQLGDVLANMAGIAVAWIFVSIVTRRGSRQRRLQT